MDFRGFSSLPHSCVLSVAPSSITERRRRMVVVFRRRVNRFLVVYPSACRWTPLLVFEADDEEGSFILLGFLFQTFVFIHYSETWLFLMGEYSATSKIIELFGRPAFSVTSFHATFFCDCLSALKKRGKWKIQTQFWEFEIQDCFFFFESWKESQSRSNIKDDATQFMISP